MVLYPKQAASTSPPLQLEKRGVAWQALLGELYVMKRGRQMRPVQQPQELNSHIILLHQELLQHHAMVALHARAGGPALP